MAPSALQVRRSLPWIALGFAALTALAIAVIDQPLARFYADHGIEARAAWSRPREVIDTYTGLMVHKWFVAFLLVGAGAIAAAVPRWRGACRVWFFAAAVHVVTRLATNELKDALGRLRPSEWLGLDGQTFLVEGGISFPSGHASHYLGVILPLAVAYPRVGLPLLAVPAFVAYSRVAVNAHFLGDILASGALVAGVTWLLARAFRIDGQPGWRRSACGDEVAGSGSG